MGMTPDRRTHNRHPHLADQIRDATGGYAMRDVVGRVLLCAPRDVELLLYPVAGNPRWQGNTGKICYPDAAAALAVTQAINAIDGADPVLPYRCPRGGHHHVVDLARRYRTTRRAFQQIADAARRAASR